MAVLRTAVLALADHVLRQWQTQMRMQCLADHQALADGDPFRVVADCGLEER